MDPHSRQTDPELHIKEYNRKRRDDEGRWKGFAVEYLEGTDWPSIIKALNDIDYQGWRSPAGISPEGGCATRMKQVVEKMDKIFSL